MASFQNTPTAPKGNSKALAHECWATDRGAFRTSRLLDFVGQRELTAQIGHGPEQWPLVIIKELTDNALDAYEEEAIAPDIEVRVDTGTGDISIADNGPGIRPETVTDNLYYSVRVPSREALSRRRAVLRVMR